jgi:hypothetical protein
MRGQARQFLPPQRDQGGVGGDRHAAVFLVAEMIEMLPAAQQDALRDGARDIGICLQVALFVVVLPCNTSRPNP